MSSFTKEDIGGVADAYGLSSAQEGTLEAAFKTAADEWKKHIASAAKYDDKVLAGRVQAQFTNQIKQLKDVAELLGLDVVIRL